MDPNRETELLQTVDEIIAQGPYAPTWESLMNAPTPQWFCREKLGIFIHWGIYSVPAKFHEWYSRNMYIQGGQEYEHHVKTYGPHKDFGYQDFIPLFKAEHFDPSHWLELFQRAGAGYIFPVAEHHDGFQMYHSDLSDWNAVNMGPKRDVLGELKAEAEKRDMVFCTSSHRAEHWFFMGHGKEFDSDIHDPMVKGDFYWPAMPEPDHADICGTPYPTEEYLNDWLARTAELILNYQPKLLYFDWWIQHEAFKPYLKRLAAFYYNCGKRWGQDVLICYKHDAMAFGSGIVEVERGGLGAAAPYPWQTDTAVARNSWCYTDSLDYKSGREVIHTLIDVVSKGGNLLLNIGPKADGTIPQGDRQILEDLAAWMQVNGEAITGAKCWRSFGEGPTKATGGFFQDGAEIPYTSADFRFTANNGAIYAICMKCPEDGHFTVKTLGIAPDWNTAEFWGRLEAVEILGYGPAAWTRDASGLQVQAPGLHSEYPVVLKITAK